MADYNATRAMDEDYGRGTRAQAKRARGALLAVFRHGRRGG
jgi:hypothetical protein